VLTNNDSRYVIQLFGARSRESVATFRRRHGLEGRTAVFELSHEGAPWYVLVFGLYDDRAAAARAIAALPAAQRSAGAWPRSVGSLRK
jgi:DamX protein